MKITTDRTQPFVSKNRLLAIITATLLATLSVSLYNAKFVCEVNGKSECTPESRHLTSDGSAICNGNVFTTEISSANTHVKIECPGSFLGTFTIFLGIAAGIVFAVCVILNKLQQNFVRKGMILQLGSASLVIILVSIVSRISSVLSGSQGCREFLSDVESFGSSKNIYKCSTASISICEIILLITAFAGLAYFVQLEYHEHHRSKKDEENKNKDDLFTANSENDNQVKFLSI